MGHLLRRALKEGCQGATLSASLWGGAHKGGWGEEGQASRLQLGPLSTW